MTTSKDTLIEEYKAADQKLAAAETAIVEAKADRSRIAKQIHDEHGAGPHSVDGTGKIATNMKGTWFLRTPFVPGGRKKAETATP
jgi:hypothetical protein